MFTKKINIIFCAYIISAATVFGGLKFPEGNNVKTDTDYRRILTDWFESATLVPYLERHKKDADKKKIEFLKKYCRFKAKVPGAESVENLLKESGKYAVLPDEKPDPMTDFENSAKSSESDPVFYAVRGDLLVQADDFYNRDSFVEAIECFNYANDNLYNDIKDKFKIIIADGIIKAGIRAEYSWSMMNSFIPVIAEYIGKDYFRTKEDLRVLNFLMSNSLYTGKQNWYVQEINKAIFNRKIKLADGIREYFKGLCLLKECYAKGKWSDESTAELNRLFKELSEKFPDIPEPWLLRFRVIYHASYNWDKKRINELFENEINAQIDYFPAYQYYTWLKRWNPESVMELFKAAARPEMDNIYLNRVAVMSLILLAEETHITRWKKIFRHPEIKQKITELYEKILSSEKITESEKILYTYEFAYLNDWMGNYDKASELLKKVPDTPSYSEEKLFFNKGRHLCRWRAELEKEIALFTGPNKELLKKWEDAVYSDDVMTALEIEEQLDQAAENDKTLKCFLLINRYLEPTNIVLKDIFYDYSWLSYFIKHNKIDQAKKLIEAGADTESCSPSYKWKPFAYAVYFGRDEMVKLLISKGADINEKAGDGFSPFMLAAKKCNLNLMKFLADKGADYNACNDAKRTPLICFCGLKKAEKYPQILDYLLSLPEIKLNEKDYLGYTALTKALDAGNFKTAEELLKHGADPNIVPYIGTPALHYAIKENQFDLFRLLLEKGADVNIRTGGVQKHHSPADFIIFYAENPEKYMKLLLKYKPALTGNDTGGDTILHNAVYCGKINCVKLLLEAGIATDKRNNYGQTPVNIAKGEIKEILTKWKK